MSTFSVLTGDRSARRSATKRLNKRDELNLQIHEVMEANFEEYDGDLVTSEILDEELELDELGFDDDAKEELFDTLEDELEITFDDEERFNITSVMDLLDYVKKIRKS